MAKLRSGIDDLVKLLEMVNEREETGEEFTEEELRQAFIPEDNDASSGDVTVGSVSISTIATTEDCEDFSSPMKICSPLNLTNGKSSSPLPPTTSTSSTSLPINQPNGNSDENMIIKDNINGTTDPEYTKDKETEETITGNGPIISPNNLNDTIITNSATNDNNVNCNNQVNDNDDRSVVGEQSRVKDEDKMLSDSGDDNVTNDSPFFTFSMVNHSITKDQSGKNLYHCYVCNAIYRHSFSLKRHFIRTHINYAFLCDADLGNCSITLALSESHLAWISRLKSTSPNTLTSTATTATSNSENVSFNSGQSSSTSGNSLSLVNINSVNGLASENLDSSMLPSSSSVITTETATYQPPKSKGLYCCHACVMFFDRIGFLRTHLRESHRSQNSDTLEAVRLPCHRCNMTFIQRAQLIRHLSSAHGLITPQPTTITTPVTTTSSASSSAAASSASSASASASSISATVTQTATTKSNTVKGIKRKKGSSSCSTTSSTSSSGCDQKNSSSEEKCDDEEEDDNSSSSQERNYLTCAQCPYKCKSPEQLKKHISSRHPIATFKCAYCKIDFKTKKQLIDHLSSVHSKSLVANNRLLKSMSVEAPSAPTPTSIPTPSTSSSSSSSSQSLNNTISTRSLKRRRANRRGANYDDDNYEDDLFECHECYAKFHIATELLKHAETVHNPSRSTRSVNNNASYRDESAFYQSLAQKISENLLFYVDGKPKVQPDNDYNNNSTSINNTENPNEIKPSTKLLNLQDYNFPPGFKLYADDDDCDVDENQQKVNTNGDLTICSIAQLNTNNNLVINSDNNNTIKDKEMEPEKDKAITTTTSTTTDTNNGLVNNCSNNQSTGIINVKPGTLVFICNACGNYFLSLSDFDEHGINNHPNVFCSYTEIEYNPNIPIDIFRWQAYSPHGLLKSCKVPVIASSTSEPSIKCTKCHNKFSTASELYQHILDCSSKSKTKSKPPIKTSSSISPSTSSSSSSSPTEPPKTNAITEPTAIMTINDNQNIRPKATSSSPQPILPIISSSSSPILSSSSTTTTANTNTTTTATPSTSCNSVPSSSSSLSSSTSTLSNCSSPRKAQKKQAPIVSPSPSTRRSGNPSRSISANSILASLSYNTRSAKKRKNDDTEIEVDFGLNVKKRNRKVRYHCTNCSEIFSHHLTFAKHRNHCLKPPSGGKEEKTVSTNANKTKNSDTSNSNLPSSSSTTSTPTPAPTVSSSPSKVTKRYASHRISSMKRRFPVRKVKIISKDSTN